MKALYIVFAIALALVAIPVDVFASSAPHADTEVTIIPAQYFDEATLAGIAVAIAGAVNAIIVKLLGPWGWAAKIARIDQLLTRYIKGALMKLVEAKPDLKAKGITVDVGNELVATAARDVLGVIPGWMIRFLGGRDRIEAAIRNRLPDVLKDLELPVLGKP